MRAVRFEGEGQLHLRDVPTPAPGPDDLLVRVEACGICGTDRHILHGEFPSAPPVTLGHEFCGTVEAVGSAVRGLVPGDRITGDPNIACGHCEFCRLGRVNLCRNLQALGVHRDGGLADHVLMPAVQAFRLPAGLPPEHGALCEPLACCLHGVDLAAIRPGTSVLVLGGGVIGLMVVQLARLAGAAAVVLATRQAARRRLAEEIGATATIDPTAAGGWDAVAGPEGLIRGGADVVIECAGVPDTVEQAFRLARTGGTVVILGVLPQRLSVRMEPFDLLTRELRVVGSFLNPFTHGRAAALIADGTIDVAPLVSRRVSLPEALKAIAEPPQPGEVRTVAMPALG